MRIPGGKQAWKRWTAIALAVPIALDLALAAYLWQSSQSDPLALGAERDGLAIQAKLLRDDVQRGERIRASLPKARAQCDNFFNQSFLDSASGYSRIDSDLGEIASKAGVKTTGFSFKQRPIKDRGVTEITISTSLDASYPAMIQFINGLERSKNFYLLDRLHLASATAGSLRLEIELHTYFRT
jgi:Type II secretion system (T2SS), protein M subtype b